MFEMKTDEGLTIQIGGTTGDGKMSMDVHFDDGSIGMVNLTEEEVTKLQNAMIEWQANHYRPRRIHPDERQ